MTFKEHIETFMNREEVSKLLDSFNSAPISAFKVNTIKAEERELFVQYKPLEHVKNAYYYDKSKDELGKSLLFNAGAFYIQEPSAMLVESLLNIKENEYVLDMCAAPGGKSFNALLDLNNTGLLVCNDINTLRAKILADNIEKYGFKNTIVLNDDSSKYKRFFVNFFDKIILDAPCSGSGMFRKDDFAIKDWSIDKVMECKKIQQSLIEDAYSMLKGQGMMVYSTCSYSIQENEEVIQEFINNHPDMELINIELNNKYHDSIGIHGGLRLYPYEHNGEGQVMFLLKKNTFDTQQGNLVKKIKVHNKIDKQVYEFLDYLKYNYNKEDVIELKNKYYLVCFDKLDLLNTHLMNYGLELGELENGRFVPNHNLALVNDMNKDMFIEVGREDAINYYNGYTLNTDSNKPNGFYIVSYNGLSLGFVKKVGSQLKNHLPKGLRVHIK